MSGVGSASIPAEIRQAMAERVAKLPATFAAGQAYRHYKGIADELGVHWKTVRKAHQAQVRQRVVDAGTALPRGDAGTATSKSKAHVQETVSPALAKGKAKRAAPAKPKKARNQDEDDEDQDAGDEDHQDVERLREAELDLTFGG